MTKKISILMVAAFGLMLSTGCQTTGPTTAELRESILTTAAEEEDGVQVAVSDPDYDPDEVICKTIKESGSRLSTKKDCRTAKQWRDSMTAATRSMNDFKDGKGGLGSKQF